MNPKHAAYMRLDYQRNPERLEKVRVRRAARTESDKRNRIRITRETRARVRVRALMLLGGMCEICGINDSRVLQIDHKNGGGNKELKRLGGDGIARRVLRNPNDYQLLCANCNWIKRWEQNEHAHI